MLENSIQHKGLNLEVECVNCGHIDNGVYCSNCGKQLCNHRLSLTLLVSGMIDHFSKMEKYLKTFTALTLNPSGFIEAYMKGINERYYLPFKYFFLNFGFHFFVYTSFKISSFEINAFDFQAEQLLQSKSEVVFETLINNYGSFFSLLIIPLYVFITKIVFKRSSYNLAERTTAITFLLGQYMIFQAGLHLISAYYHPFYGIQKCLLLIGEYYMFFLLSYRFFKAPLIEAIWKSLVIGFFVLLSIKGVLALTQYTLQLYFGD
jgi:Protein of unknown function (DUF3667)